MPLRRFASLLPLLPLLPLLLLVAGRGAPEVAADEPPAPPAAGPGAPTLEERDVRIPMRDGAVLAANVARPRAPGRYPAIVVQTPYDKNRLGREVGDLPGAGEAGRGSLKAWARMDREHYAYVIVDWRGFFGSRAAGAGRRPGHRGEDGFDVVEWVAAQPWCDGRVGTWGGSALGKAQLDTAAEQPPHLVCAVPLTHGPKDITSLGARADLVAFATAPLAEPLALRGAVDLTLTVACDRPDVDLVLLLGDTFPDGRTYLVGETIQRASLRGREVQPLRPGEAVPVTLRLPPHAWTFQSGHRLTCWITSGSWPRYERNPHSGALRWEASSARDVSVSLRLGAGEATLRLPLVAR